MSIFSHMSAKNHPICSLEQKKLLGYALNSSDHNMLRSDSNSLQTETSSKINILEFCFKILFVLGGLLLMLSQYVKSSVAQIM